MGVGDAGPAGEVKGMLEEAPHVVHEILEESACARLCMAIAIALCCATVVAISGSY
jgi:hypothetical protein